jgi:aromatic-amino-acid transaminase
MTTATATSALIPGSRGRAGNDPIFALYAEASKRAAAGESILNATMGALINDDGTLSVMPTVIETLSGVRAAQAAGYAPISGTPTYRAAVVADLFGDGPLADQAVAVATPGGTGAVYQAVVNFLDPVQSLLVPSYYWGPYGEIARNSGRAIDTFEMFGADGAFDIDGMVDALERHASTQGRVLLVLNFPCHNPTGYSLSLEAWKRASEAIAGVGERVPVTVLIDAA